MLKDSFIIKIRLIQKIVASERGEQPIVIHILTIISRSKDNKAMKFSQLICGNRKRFFLKNQTQNAVATLFTDRFFKYQNRASLDQYSEVLYSLFLIYVELRTI